MNRGWRHTTQSSIVLVLFSLKGSVAQGAASITLGPSPQLIQCGVANFQWSGGIPPYQLLVRNQDIIKPLTKFAIEEPIAIADITNQNFTLRIPFLAGTNLTWGIAEGNNRGQLVASDVIEVRPSSENERNCIINATSPVSSSQAIPLPNTPNTDLQFGSLDLNPKQCDSMTVAWAGGIDNLLSTSLSLTTLNLVTPLSYDFEDYAAQNLSTVIALPTGTQFQWVFHGHVNVPSVDTPESDKTIESPVITFVSSSDSSCLLSNFNVLSNGSSSSLSIAGTSTVLTPSPPATSSATASPDHKSLTTAIVGGVVGGVIVLLVIAIVSFLIWRRKRRRESDNGSDREVTPNYVLQDSTIVVEPFVPPPTTGPQSSVPKSAQVKTPEATSAIENTASVAGPSSVQDTDEHAITRSEAVSQPSATVMREREQRAPRVTRRIEHPPAYQDLRPSNRPDP